MGMKSSPGALLEHSAWSAAEVVLAVSAVVLAVDLVLVLAALSRFQRSKLVLD
jgi:hypothetical protein